MRRKNVRRCYLLIVGGCAVAAAYYATVTLPLLRSERALDQRLFAAVDKLAAAGHGMSTEEVTYNIQRLQADIDAFTETGSDPGRTIQFPPEVEEMLVKPFQLYEYNGRKFLVVDRIRNQSAEQQVTLFEGWERKLPAFTSQPPYQLWAQLTAMDQLLRTAIGAGVKRIDNVEILAGAGGGGSSAGEATDGEVAVRMQLTGKMEAIHSILMMLPLNGEELAALKINGAPELKSSFFLNRFILKKTSAENADEVNLDFVVSGFVDMGAGS